MRARARHSLTRQCRARRGNRGQARLVRARLGMAGHGTARLGVARQGRAGEGKRGAVVRPSFQLARFGPSRRLFGRWQAKDWTMSAAPGRQLTDRIPAKSLARHRGQKPSRYLTGVRQMKGCLFQPQGTGTRSESWPKLPGCQGKVRPVAAAIQFFQAGSQIKAYVFLQVHCPALQDSRVQPLTNAKLRRDADGG